MSKQKKKAWVPKLRFPEFREVGAWNISTIGEISSISSGGTPSRAKAEYWNGDISWISTTLINFNTIKIANEYITKSGLQNSSTKIFPKNTILMAMYGQGKTRGKVAILGIEAAINQACAAITLKEGMNANFVFQNLAARYDEIRKISNQGGQENLSAALIKKILFSYPDINSGEQQKIAACLSSLDDLITAQTQKIDALKAHKKGLMQQLFPAEGETVPKLRFREFLGAGEWEEKRLADVCVKIMDGTHFSPKSKTGPYLYLTSKNIRNNQIDLSEVSYISAEEHKNIYKRCPVKIYDVLLTKDGSNTGNCALNNINSEFSLLSSVAVLRGNSVLLNQNFLYQTILSEEFQKRIRESIAGQAITRITLEKIQRYSISLPCIQEQKCITACLSSLDNVITFQTQKLDALKTHKKGLMQQLFPAVDEADK